MDDDSDMNDTGGTESGRLTRRALMTKLFSGMAAGAVLPMVGNTHPIYEHFRNAAVVNRAQETRKAAGWAPLFLSAKQNEALVALGEAVVPGSTKARVSQFIDLLLSVETKENQNHFVESLSAIETSARQRFGRIVQALTAGEQETLLTAVSQSEAHHDHFDNLKEWISVAYYSSEEGMRELGWSGRHAFVNFPGCDHADDSH
jgi:hypothetical protein